MAPFVSVGSDSGYSGITVSIFLPLQQHFGQALTTLRQQLMVTAIKKSRKSF